jgi:hypothetical protein
MPTTNTTNQSRTLFGGSILETSIPDLRECAEAQQSEHKPVGDLQALQTLMVHWIIPRLVTAFVTEQPHTQESMTQQDSAGETAPAHQEAPHSIAS